MSYEFYKVIHFFGILLVFTSLMGIIILKYFSQLPDKDVLIPIKKLSASHGIGLLLMVLSGFGLASRLEYLPQLPLWVIFKIMLWLISGGILVVIKRKRLPVWIIYLIVLVIPILGSILAVNKPF